MTFVSCDYSHEKQDEFRFLHEIRMKMHVFFPVFCDFVILSDRAQHTHALTHGLILSFGSSHRVEKVVMYVYFMRHRIGLVDRPLIIIIDQLSQRFA